MAFERFKKFNIDPLIAKQPADPRDSSRLMVLHRSTEKVEHRIFRDIAEYFNEGDVLVLNNTKVF
ncbi:MAG: S-adenosylmethionine:tRNA ribosyltransferase-isomerase, partial [Elusimicrobiaceae bacterium]|nr:S-adenosylmethionine:tRNA ribosyltransferase-isomerase [Elusimicrobiaceae bacterium]